MLTVSGQLSQSDLAAELRMTPELIAEIEAAFERLQSWKGQLVRIEECITRAVGHEWAYDRHFCTQSSFALLIASVAWALSGSSVMIVGSLGGQPGDYQLTTDRVVSADLPDLGTVCFVERFGEEAERRSLFKLLASGQDTKQNVAPECSRLT
jgi:hypothetical protein